MTIPDSVVSTVSMKRWALMCLAAVGMSCGLMLIVFVAVRMHQTYIFESQMLALQVAHRELQINCSANKSEIEKRLEMIERVIFGDVLPKVEKTPTSVTPQTPRIEQLIVANQREFRARIESLERWRLRMMD